MHVCVWGHWILNTHKNLSFYEDIFSSHSPASPPSFCADNPVCVLVFVLTKQGDGFRLSACVPSCGGGAISRHCWGRLLLAQRGQVHPCSPPASSQQPGLSWSALPLHPWTVTSLLLHTTQWHTSFRCCLDLDDFSCWQWSPWSLIAELNNTTILILVEVSRFLVKSPTVPKVQKAHKKSLGISFFP